MPDITFAARMRSLYTQYFVYWAWLVVVIILTVGFFLVIYPLWTNIQETGAFHYTELEQTQQARETELSQLKLMSSHLKELNQSQLLLVQHTLPKDFSDAELMEQVVDEFATQGLTVNSIDVVDSKATVAEGSAAATTNQKIPGVKQLQLTVSLTGDATYQGFKDFLQSVATSNPILELASISYSLELQSYALVFNTYAAE